MNEFDNSRKDPEKDHDGSSAGPDQVSYPVRGRRDVTAGDSSEQTGTYENDFSESESFVADEQVTSEHPDKKENPENTSAQDMNTVAFETAQNDTGGVTENAEPDNVDSSENFAANEQVDSDILKDRKEDSFIQEIENSVSDGGGESQLGTDLWDEILESANRLKAEQGEDPHYLGSRNSESATDQEKAATLEEALQEIEEENKRTQQERTQKTLFETPDDSVYTSFSQQDPQRPDENAGAPVNADNLTAPGTEKSEQGPDNIMPPPPAGQSAQTNFPGGGYPYQRYPGYPPYGRPPVFNQETPEFHAIPPEPPVKKRNTGLMVFCILLSLVLVVTGGVTAGYYLGRDQEDTANYSDSLFSQPETVFSKPAQSSEESVVPDNIGGEVNVPIHDKPVDTEQLTTSEAAKQVTESVVGIIVYSMYDTTTGSEATGVIISSDGYILTNDHVYSGIQDPQFIIVLSDGTKCDAKFVAGDTRSDLAVLKADATGLKPAQFGNSNQLEVGENVIAIGNPGGISLAGTVTMGVVSGVNRRVYSDTSSYSMKCIQTDAAINPGNSGGPLINLYGQVVGINSSKIVASGYEGIGFSIPSITAKEILDNLVQYGYVNERAKLGVTYTTLDIVAARQNDMPSGLYINSVSEESDLSGKVVRGEMITSINDIEITEGSEVLDIIEASKPGDVVALEIYSPETEKSRTIEAKLIEDKGSSSYNNQVIESSEVTSDPFEDFLP